jgi:cobaltochelatase CobN
VAVLPGPDNWVARNTQAVAQKLVNAGASAAQAQAWATTRVFSNEQGGYGTGLSEGVLATDTWAKADKGGGDAQLAQLYIDRMGHAGLPGTPSQGTVAGETAARQQAYASNLAQVDAALLSRTSNTYGVLTSDDPFQYLGGIALAVRQLTGREPSLYVQNLRDETEIKTDSAAIAIAKEMQTRYLHPQWIKAQQAEGYSGTLQVLKTANFLWGWQVTAPKEVRQDHWQSLHDVYVRDQYQLGTRQWLEGDNRAAFAQTLERMLDAVRLNYWQPDAATRKELVQAYTESLKATGLRESNPQVQRFASQQLKAEAQPAPAPTAPKAAPAQAAKLTQPDSTTESTHLQGLQLVPQVIAKALEHQNAVITSLAALLGVGALLALGAWRQMRRAYPPITRVGLVAGHGGTNA